MTMLSKIMMSAILDMNTTLYNNLSSKLQSFIPRRTSDVPFVPYFQRLSNTTARFSSSIAKISTGNNFLTSTFTFTKKFKIAPLILTCQTYHNQFAKSFSDKINSSIGVAFVQSLGWPLKFIINRMALLAEHPKVFPLAAIRFIFKFGPLKYLTYFKAARIFAVI